MNANPLVSVCLPIYNTERFLRKCLDSIINQSYRDMEIILAVECSSDGSALIADEYAKKDSRIKIIHQKEHLGLSGARNIGIENATGEYITFVDSDDYVELDYVDYLLKIIQETQADIALSRNFFTPRGNKQIKNDVISVCIPEDILCDIFYNRIHVGVWNRLYKRDLIINNNIRFRVLSKAGEGMHFNSQIMPKAKSIGVGLRKVYTYRLDNDESATTKPNIEKQAMGAIENMEHIRNNISLKSEKLNAAVEYQYFTTTLYALKHIILTKDGRRNYKTFYVSCIKYLRKSALSTLRSDINFKQKLKSLAMLVSPDLTIRLAIFYRKTLGFE